MGKAIQNSKAAEKKRERLEMEKKMNARVAIVKAANNTSDPLENLPSFKVKSLSTGKNLSMLLLTPFNDFNLTMIDVFYF